MVAILTSVHAAVCSGFEAGTDLTRTLPDADSMHQMSRRIKAALMAICAATVLALASPGAALAQEAQPRVVGGSTVSISKYPWQAAVAFSQAKKSTSDPFERQFCGGSLITPRIVITAAHCIEDGDPDCPTVSLCPVLDTTGDGTEQKDPDDLAVILGRTTLTDTSQGTEHAVLDRRIHPTYDSSDLSKDIAYIVLTTASSQPTIAIAGSAERALWAPGAPTEVSGWGSTSEGGSRSDTLRAAVAPIIDDSACSSPTVYNGLFDPATMVCAGYLEGGIDTCQGDSGGPLQAPIAGGSYRLVGITSWGIGCARPNKPGVYTRVAEPALTAEIQAQLDNLERSAPPPPGTNPAQTNPVNPFAKCKRAKTKKKRKRCNRKVRATLRR